MFIHWLPVAEKLKKKTVDSLLMKYQKDLDGSLICSKHLE